MRKTWKIGVLIVILLTVVGILLFFILSYFLYISRIPEVGDVFVYREMGGLEAGAEYEIRVTDRNEARKTLTFTGTPRGSSFYTLKVEFSYAGKYLEIGRIEGWDYEAFACDIARGEGGFLFAPLKRVFRKAKEFGFRAVCEGEGSIAFMDHPKWAKEKEVIVPAGVFDTYRISHRVTYPFQEEEEGRGTFYFSPALGFLVKFEIVTEGRTYRFELVSYTRQEARKQ